MDADWGTPEILDGMDRIDRIEARPKNAVDGPFNSA
jgi:hypothetical protein